MRRNEKILGVRLGVSGGRKFKADMQGIGKAGQNSMRKIENSARAATPELLIMNKAAGGLNSILRQGAGLAAAYVSINTLFSSVSGFATFEQNLVGVGKTTNIVGAELKSLGDDVDALSRRLPVAADHLLEIAQSAGQLGVKGSQNILLFTETIAKLESASDLVGEDGAKSLARILNVTGEATDNIDDLSSAVVALGNNMEASESEIVSQATEVAKAGAAYDITSAQATGLGGAFAAMGIQAELSGSTVTRVLLAMDDAIAKGGDKLRLLSELTGIAPQDLERAFGENAIAVFEKFLGGLNRIGQSGGRISATLDKFGLSSVRVLKTLPVMALRVDDVSAAIALSNKAFAENIALNKEAAAAYDTLGSEGKILSNTMDSLSRGFAGGFSDELKSSTKEITALTEAAIPASRELGEDFAPAVVFASKSLVTLTENGGTIIKVLGGLVIARSAAAGFVLLSSSLIGNAGAIIGLRAMIAVSPVAAAKMVATAGAAKFLGGALALIGGPAGLAVLAAGGLLLLATRESAATRIAREHVEVIGDEEARLRALTTASDEYNRSLSDRERLRIQDIRNTLNAEIANDKDFINKERNKFLFLKGPKASLLGTGDATEEFKGGFAANERLNDLNKNFNDGNITVTEYADSLAALAIQYGEATDEIKPLLQALELMEKKMERIRELDALERFGNTIPIRDKPSRESANDNLLPVTVQSFPNLAARDEAALAALKEVNDLQKVKVLSQTVAQYDEGRAAIASTLAGMEIDALRATRNITEAIRAEADAQIAIWKQRAKDFPEAEQEMFRAITLINQQAARDIADYQKEMDIGLQAGKSAAATFNESLIAAGATSETVLEQLGRSFRTTMLKMLTDALLLKPLESFFGSIFSTIASFLPGAAGSSGGSTVIGPGTIPSANGNAFSNGNIIPFARGGVFDTPQIFPMSGGRTGLMAEAGPEAILPLSRGRDGKLGVASSGGGVVVNLTIVNAPAGTETRRKARADGGVDIDVIIPNAVASDILNGGDVADAIESRFGIAAGGV